MRKLLRIAPAAAVMAALTFLAPAVPAKDKTASPSAQTTAEKDTAKHKHKHEKHSKATTGSNAGASQTPAAPAK